MLTDETFDQTLADAQKRWSDTGNAVILFFGMENCGPTIAMWPVIEDVMEALDHDVTILTVNVDLCPQATKRFKIKQTPTSILVKDNEPLGTIGGTMTAIQMIAWATNCLAPKPEKKTRKKKD